MAMKPRSLALVPGGPEPPRTEPPTDEPPLSGLTTIKRGVYRDAAPVGMILYKSVDDTGHVVEWYCTRAELFKPDEPDEMLRRLDAWNRELNETNSSTINGCRPTVLGTT